MTTTVSVAAHCGSDKKVHVSVKDRNGEQITVLQDGESTDVYAYDERKITVSEVPKDENDE